MAKELVLVVGVVALAGFAGLMFWMWPKPGKVPPLTDAQRAELVMRQKFSRLWFLAGSTLIEPHVLERRRVEGGWMQIAREHRRTPIPKTSLLDPDRTFYYHHPPVLNVRIRHDTPLEIGLDLRTGYSRPLSIVVDEPPMLEPLLTLTGEAIRAAARYTHVYASDEEVVIEVGAASSREQLDWVIARALVIARLVRDDKRRLGRTKPFADLLDGLRPIAAQYGLTFDDDTVVLQGPVGGAHLVATVVRDRYRTFKLAIKMPFPTPLGGKFLVTPDRRDELDRLFTSADLTIGDPAFDQVFHLHGELPAMGALLAPPVREALLPLGREWIAEVHPAGLTVNANGIGVVDALRAIVATLEAAPVLAARAEVIARGSLRAPA